MPKLVVMGAMLKCDKGTAPSSLAVIPSAATTGDGPPAATIMDFAPMVNIPPFAMCQGTNSANPAVAAATAAASGTPTPAPCIPVTTSPWSPGSSTTTIGGNKALTADSTCKCAWTGTIEITDAGQSSIDVDG